ncbi:MAG: M48 family metallopeptidase [Clostridia bacterium]
MFEDIKKNKIKSGFVIFGFLVMLSLILYYICMAFNVSGPAAITFALIFSICSTWITYYNSDKIVLKLANARPATLEEDKKVVGILDALMLSAGLEYRPKLYIVDSNQPNAFATGRNPKNSVICLTTALLDKLNYYELEGVIAHEMSHIKNYDILLSAVVSVLLGLIVMLSDMFSRISFSKSDRDNDNKASVILMILGVICLVFAPLFGKLMQLALSRRREFLADATAVEITRNPNGLISALRKLDADTNTLNSVNSATANMYIVTPFKGKERKSKDLFSTHPSIEDRIAALENIK